MKNKKFLEICLSPDLGGLELYMARCSNNLSKDFEVLCVIASNSKLKNYICDINKIELKRKSSFSIFSALKLAKIIDDKKIDLIHLHWTKDIPIVVFAKIVSKRKPKIIQTRHMTMTSFKNDFYHKFLYKNIHMIIAVTKEVQKQLIKFLPKKSRPIIKQIYLGSKAPIKYKNTDIENLRIKLGCKNSFMVGFVGRISEFKGQYLLIEAMKELERKKLDIKVFFVGHPMKESYLNKLKQKVKNYKLEKHIKFLGFMEEPHKFMKACDTIVVASKNETFGLVVIEAMKNETVVIGSNSGGILEIIDDNKNGLLFQNEKYSSLAEKIEYLYENKKILKKLSQKAQLKSNLFFDDVTQFNKLKKELNGISL